MSQRADSMSKLPLEALEQIDRICERFEAEWSSGSAPSLEEFMAMAPVVGREVLLWELVSLDREYRGRRGEAPSFEEYAGQLPQDIEVLRAAWSEAGETDGSPNRIGVLPARDRGSSSGAPAAGPRGARRFGDYELVRELGKGGMGVVYEARQVSLNRLVALKMIKDSEFASVDDRLRFQNEARVVAILDHPNIVPILEVGEFEGQHCFSMKLIAGGSLSQRLDAYAADPGATAALVIAVAEAVHYAHQRGILHRDLKPANILVDEHGRPHVTDFGLAKRIDDDSELTRTGAVVGTPSYMAPEQALGRSGSTTVATDVYGLGTILYALLANRAPFAGDTPFQTIEQLRDRAPDPPSQYNPGVPRDMEVICLKCLEKDPKWRFASAQALADDLRHWQAGEPIAARPVGAPTRAWMWCKRKPLLAGLVTGLVVALAGGFVGVATQWRRAETSLSLVKSANAHLEKARNDLQQNLYCTEMALTQQSMDSALGTDRVQDLLAHWYPAGTEPDRRGWEWYYLRGLGWRDHLTLVVGHRPIGVVSWSPDGRRLASTDHDGRLVLWDPNTGGEITAWRGHTRVVNGLFWSWDGRRLLSADVGGTIKSWSTDTWRETATLQLSPPSSGEASAKTWSPDGRRLASASSDGTVKIWDAGTGTALATLRGHTRGANGVCWSPDGRRLASASSDGTIKLWDAGTGTATATLEGPTAGVFAVSWSPDGRRLASGNSDGTVQLWDIVAARPIATMRGHSTVYGVAWSPNGHRLASSGSDHQVKVWDTDAGAEIVTLRGHETEAFALAWSPDGRRLASGDFHGTVQLWDMAPDLDEDCGNAELRGHADAVYALSWSSNDRRLASASLDHSIRLWDTGTRREITTLRGHTNRVDAVTWSPDDRRLASASRDGTIKLWDAGTGRETTTLNGQAGAVAAVSWSPDGRRLASAHFEGSVKIWDPDTGRELTTLKGHDNVVWTVSWSPDGRRLASGGQDGTIRLWDASTRERMATLRGHTWEVKGVCWSPDGRRLASASIDGTVRLWDAGTGAALATLGGHTDWVAAVSWSPDGRRLASAGMDHTVKVWDPDYQREIITLKGHTDQVNDVKWSSDGKRLASAGRDRMVRLWDARPGYARQRSH
jgi:eukaryotic-like serine/threonine-protein kinase